ncbi:phosphocholine-specific phospholipase C [Mucilaginibacter sp. L196]|uniref:phosphocholine-specific phospholipase C n=1 Tax=Mucilaginibacter sp. L196 TaxID=1641870 RepID=UPI00131CD114|nr:phospholipase C, phosphocholine-specific [Mucilaginibacter sp. L196]
MDTRRNFIKKAALLTGATGLTTILPSAIQRAMAINPMPGSTYMDAEHVVILMQENRSFDHMFGTLRGVRGYNDPRAIHLPNKNKVWLQSNDKGETYAPFHLDIKNTKSTWMNSLPHTWQNQVAARNDGKFDKWLESKRSGNAAYADMPLTLGHHNRDDIPFYYALADAFTVCDQNFCSSLTGTSPNRLFFWSGTIREQQNEDSHASVWNEDADFGGLKWTTFPERLEDNGISWKCYQNEIGIETGLSEEEGEWLSNFTDNPLEYFAQYNIFLNKKRNSYAQKRKVELSTEIETVKQKIVGLPVGNAQAPHLKAKLKAKQNDLADIEKELAAIKPGAFEKLSRRDKNIHEKAFITNQKETDYRELTTLTYDDNGTKREVKVPKGDVLKQFREDVNSGSLPTVSWLVAPENFSDHPSAPWYGAWYVSEVMDILTKNPEVWKKTIFILNYDENDGYFDHVPPFVAPHSHRPGTGKVSEGIDTRVEYVTLEQEQARNGFPEKDLAESPIGLGYRVPLVIASPWSRGGFVNSEVFDHTSILQFLEHFLSKKTGKPIKETNISDWRRTICGDLTSVFRQYNGEEIKEPDFLVRDTVVEDIHKAKFKALPSDFKVLTAEEIKQINDDPASSPYLPKQEVGIRPSCAVNYQLHADGSLNEDRSIFNITFAAGSRFFGADALGAPYNVYAPGRYLQEDARSWAYALKAGDHLTDSWPLHAFEGGNYHLRVYGPNGFFREFGGSAGDPEVALVFDYQATKDKKPTGDVAISFRNLGKQTCRLQLIDNTGREPVKTLPLAAGSVLTGIIKLQKSYGWYDFTIKSEDSDIYLRRFAGHVDTGQSSFSDPIMGRVSV